MYSHILIPTDGSTLSLKAARAGVELARKLGARVTALHVIESFRPAYAGDGLYYSTAFTEKQYLESMRIGAGKALAKVQSIAEKLDVKCAAESVVHSTPWEGIIKSAAKFKADTIVMASHGRGGIAAVVIGSQTNRVLTHSKIPVLVCR